MPSLISPAKDRRSRILDVKGDRTERYDVYDHRSGAEFIVRDLTTCKHFSHDSWQRVIKYEQKSFFFIPHATGIPQATNPNKSKKNKATDNQKPDDWKPYAEAYLIWKEKKFRGEEE